MTPDTYKLLQRCVEDGIELGINRAYKHTATPDQESIAAAVEQAVMTEICEWFRFEDAQ